MKNWRTKLAATLTGLWSLVPILSDGFQGTDLEQIGKVAGTVATIWFLRDAVQKSGPPATP